MRWQTAYTTALAVGLFSGSTTGFIVAPRPLHVPAAAAKTRLNVGGMGWDNENFLEALGGGNDEREDANEDYYRHSRFGREGPPEIGGDGEPEPPRGGEEDLSEGIEGAALTPDMIAKAKASHTPEEEASQGGRRFKALREAAQQGAAQPEQRFYEPPPPPQQPVDPNNLSVEEQAAMFRQMQAQQQQGEAYPEPAPRMKQVRGNPVAPDGRRVGRNRDADAIQNTSDVYFAQLKRDSTLRNYARYAGDEVTANKPFADPSIQDFHVPVNPHLQKQKEQEKDLFDLSDDELFNMRGQEDTRPTSYSGVSYRDKLKQKKKGGGTTAKAAPKAPPPPPEEPKAVVETPVVEQAPEVKRTPPPPPPPPPPVKQEVAAQVQAKPAVEKPLPPPPPPKPEQPAAEAAKDIRNELRTLQGLLLKHRGGSGFGPGRLQGAEKARFEQLALDITAVLQDEALTSHVPSQVTAATDRAVTVQLDAPPQQQPTPPAAMTSGAIQQKPTVPTGDRINSLMSCVEGAFQMYRNSPPELQEGVLVTMRAALLSAVNTCNDIIAQNEVQNYQAYQQQQQPVQAQPASEQVQSSSKPMQWTDVLAVEEEASPVVTETAPPAKAELPTVGTTQTILEQVYDKLKAAAGDGKLGLREDLSAAEAEELADNIAEMRSLLVDELENGIPSGDEGSGSSASSSSSRYEEMLAKARAKKAAGSS